MSSKFYIDGQLFKGRRSFLIPRVHFHGIVRYQMICLCHLLQNRIFKSQGGRDCISGAPLYPDNFLIVQNIYLLMVLHVGIRLEWCSEFLHYLRLVHANLYRFIGEPGDLGKDCTGGKEKNNK